MGRVPGRPAAAAAGAAAALIPWEPAAAHALGGRYDLPLPLGFYLAGAGLAVALSFVGAIALHGRGSGNGGGHRLDLLATPAGRGLMRSAIPRLLRGAGLVLLGFVVATALFGSPHPGENPAVTLIWVIFWVGGAYLSVILGDTWWRAVDPWRTGFRLWERFAARRGWAPHRGWPAPGMGGWPAFALLAAVFWLELVYPDAARPRTLAVLIAGYTLITWTGMFLYGPRRWLQRGEAFAALFRQFARLAPVSVCPGGSGSRPGVEIHRPGANLTPRQPVSRSTTALILLLLAAVSFDGLTATPQWAAAWRALTSETQAGALLRGLETWGLNGYVLASTFAFAATAALFAGLYTAACAAAARLVRFRGNDRTASTGGLADILAPSLLPIGVGYHLAHYFSYLLVQGQRLIPQLSDPFGTGADWFGTANHRIDIGIVSPAVVWYFAVAAVVAGHVIAVYSAHRLALMHLGDRRIAARSQIPLVGLMIAYTVFSLWLFAQPTVEIG